MRQATNTETTMTKQEIITEINLLESLIEIASEATQHLDLVDQSGYVVRYNDGLGDEFFYETKSWFIGDTLSFNRDGDITAVSFTHGSTEAAVFPSPEEAKERADRRVRNLNANWGGRRKWTYAITPMRTVVEEKREQHEEQARSFIKKLNKLEGLRDTF